MKEIQSIDKMRVLGTTANSPFAIRNFDVSGKFGIRTVPTLVFPWKLVLDILNSISAEIDEN